MRDFSEKQVYCTCGQYLNKHFITIAQNNPGTDITIYGIPCPAENCDKTYSLVKQVNKIIPSVEATDYNKIIKGYRYKVPDDVLEEIKGIAANFHFRNGFKNDDGSVGSIRITYDEFLDCLAHAFSRG